MLVVLRLRYAKICQLQAGEPKKVGVMIQSKYQGLRTGVWWVRVERGKCRWMRWGEVGERLG